MKIDVTNEALEHFKEKQLSSIRIVARDTFECSTMVEFYLQVGKKTGEDQEVVIHDISFLYDEKAEEDIGEAIKIDFVHAQGLKLLAPRGTLAYAQKVKSADS
ncbi:iron-sulfur cluster biosynthesis family protein [Shouchella sp. JSM 1781072]|uniref:iron-sulfur cluster biosynthesis family protein n=1 Tax=Bacillaceae TaxID=186817 RepID=UPI0020D0AC67|nr:iron-sulfur cluster biosynthesis family protein [Alkalihalobacillus sp. LMS6]UTR04654.1 hypothetical protein MM326_10920 [Alkalihalobacillus sp. LMS6]